MKKIAAIIPAAVLALALAACSGTNEPQATMTQTEPQTETTTEQVTETVPESEMIIYTTAETETVAPDYIQDEDSESWFQRIYDERERGSVEPLDSSSTGIALYELINGEKAQDMIFDASVADCSSVRLQGNAEGTLTGCSVYKLGGDTTDKDSASGYGKNAAVQALDGAFLKVMNTRINASAAGASGLAACNRSVICIADSWIDVSGMEAAGLLVAGNGKICAWNTEITGRTAVSCSGEGSVEVNGGTLEGDVIALEGAYLRTSLADCGFTGAANPGGSGGDIAIALYGESVWKLTGDSFVTSFEGSLDNVDTGDFHLYVDGEQVK